MELPETRIVSFLPAATELVYALGAGPQLVGVSHECDHPEAARRLPPVLRPKIRTDASSRDIDAQVKRLARNGESLYEIDEELLRALEPDFILTQTLCDVCAITPAQVEEAVKRLERRPEIVTLEAQSLESVLADVRKLGKVLGREAEAKDLLFRQWRLIKQIRARVQGLDVPRVAILDWADPVMFAGNWIPGLAKLAGGDAALVPEGQPSRWGSWEELEEYEPEVLLVAPCGRSVKQTARELRGQLETLRRGDFAPLDEGRVWVADGHQFFNRPGPRLVYSAALMARAFHPTLPPLPETLERHLVRFAAE